MALPIPKVEIGFDIVGTNSPFFTLDDPTKGVLDNVTYTLSGSIFYDVTNRVKSITTRRGKNRQLDQYDPGLANVVFNNEDRTFDPEYPDSPYAGQIIPRRAIRISSEGQQIFQGTIDDWNLEYVPFGLSEASAACSDAFSNLRSQTLAAGTATPQKTGQRINTVLSSADVNWPTESRDIETGQTDLGADVIAEDTNALDYLRKVAASEPGSLFIDAQGNLVFQDRNPRSSSNYITFADDGSGISYQSLKVVYGSELLYNEIVLGNVFGVTATSTDAASVAEYGILNYTSTGLLTSDSGQLVNIAVLLASKYSSPEYRFESLEVILDKFDAVTQRELLALDMGDIVQIKFTPNNIPPAITKFAEVIRVDHAITPSGHVMSLGFSTIDNSFWTLSDAVFGRLSASNTLGF